MKAEKLEDYFDQGLEVLKDFQLATVEFIHQQFYEKNQPRFLVADEVGLGKTVVARGLIAKILKARKAAKVQAPFRVMYICSNQVLARENLKKLNLFPESFEQHTSISRISLLAWEWDDTPTKTGRERQDCLELHSLTPGTSFHISAGTGIREERSAIYAALCESKEMRKQKDGLRWMLKSGVQNQKAFFEKLESDRKEYALRDGVTERYIGLLKDTAVPTCEVAIYETIGEEGPLSLFEVTRKFAEVVDGRRWNKLYHCCESLCRRLRKCLVEACLPELNADLYILDEFQRFSDLIDSEVESDAASLAQKVFFEGNDNSRILLLSATPFKAFTSSAEEERGEDHFKDFTKVLRFLLRDNEELVEQYEEHRRALQHQIFALKKGGIENLTSEHRQEVENVLRKVMCRTERFTDAADSDGLIKDVWNQTSDQVALRSADIANFVETDRIAKALEAVPTMPGRPVEYCKSAPFPLSFLEHYQLKRLLQKYRRISPAVRKALRNSKPAWLDSDSINHYADFLGESPGSKLPTVGNSRLSQLIDHAVGQGGELLLWVPPSLPYYELEGSFKNQESFSKTLVFSSWVMVPRMISTLVSFEIERRTIGDPRSLGKNEDQERRVYFSPPKQRRLPVQQIRFNRSGVGDEAGQFQYMTSSALLYPCVTLAKLFDPEIYFRQNLPLSKIRAELIQEIRKLIKEAGLSKYETKEGQSDRWYWAAPLLLDQESDGIRKWLQGFEVTPERRPKSQKDPDSDVSDVHFAKLREFYENPGEIHLGPIPEALAETLADLALGSPAILALRTLTRLSENEDLPEQLNWSSEIAVEFCSLFNKPESIAALRIGGHDGFYWRVVLDYCRDGCLQSVLDEFFHIVKGQRQSASDAVEQIKEAVNLNTSVVKVDSWESFRQDEPLRMRCHYAAEFGSQRIETDSGEKRAVNLRGVFNSPFRPFVLATTSVGQEGLDFHSYCRRIVHWNLPGNPVDFEQREGRINRYKSLAIRQQIASKYGHLLKAQSANDPDLWEALFKIADEQERVEEGKSELVPFWHIEPTGESMIERVIPMYPFSRDRSRLNRMLKTLALYRLAFGQPRQSELIEYLLEAGLTDKEIEKIKDSLLIRLSPSHYSSEPGLLELP